MNKDELRARAARAATRRRDEQEAQPAKPAVARPKLSAKKISLTVQLQEGVYDQLKSWPDAVGLTAKLKRKRVPTVEIMRALVEELMSNDELRDKIVRRLVRNMS